MLILASNSPRRRQLLALAGWTFSNIPASIDEQPYPDEDPQTYVVRLAEQKARRVHTDLPADSSLPAYIVAADTTVAAGGQILGKPLDEQDAQDMLRRLRGGVHQVYTGLGVMRVADGELRTELTATDVRMRNYSDEEIQSYIATGDPLDKAGAYAIQHAGFHPVAALRGCYANVVGMPICRLAHLLQGFGLAPDAEPQLACSSSTGQHCGVYETFAHRDWPLDFE